MAYIDKDKLNEAFTALRFNEDGTLRHWDDRPNWCMSGQEVEDLINSIPTANVVEVKTGKWFFSDTDFLTHCSNCGQSEWKGYCPTPEEATEWMPICPKCGADMRKETENATQR